MMRLKPGDKAKVAVGIVAIVLVMVVAAASGPWGIGLRSLDLRLPVLSWGGYSLADPDALTSVFPVDDVHALSVNWTGGDVHIERGSGDEVRVLVELDPGSYAFDPSNVSIELRDGRLLVDDGIPDAVSADGCEKMHLTVVVPSASPELDRVTVSSMSAGVTVDRLACKALSVDTMSGAHAITDLDADELALSSMSGSISASGIVRGSVDASAQSGSLDLALGSLPSTVSLDTMSGAVDLDVPDDAGFTLDVSTMSGDLSSDLPGELTRLGEESYRYGEGGSHIAIDTMSGSIRLS